MNGSCVLRWDYGEWETECPAECVRFRNSSCMTITDIVVEDLLCASLVKNVSANCFLGSCVYHWEYGAWGGCTAACVRVLEKFCLAANGIEVDATNCSNLLPVVTKVFANTFSFE